MFKNKETYKEIYDLIYDEIIRLAIWNGDAYEFEFHKIDDFVKQEIAAILLKDKRYNLYELLDLDTISKIEDAVSALLLEESEEHKNSLINDIKSVAIHYAERSTTQIVEQALIEYTAARFERAA